MSDEQVTHTTPGQNPHRCGDSGCVLLVPGAPVGMAGNAGCRCLGWERDPNQRVRVRAGIRWLAERVIET